MTMAHLTANSALNTLAVVLVVLTTAVILWLVVKTALAAAKRAIFLPE